MQKQYLRKKSFRHRPPGPSLDINPKVAMTILDIMTNEELIIFRDAANALLAQPDRKVRNGVEMKSAASDNMPMK